MTPPVLIAGAASAASRSRGGRHRKIARPLEYDFRMNTEQLK